MSAALPNSTREIQLASRPQGRPVQENFRLAETDLPELQDHQILVRNEFMSVDPYRRGRMNDVKSYSAPFRLDAALDNGAVWARSSRPVPTRSRWATSSCISSVGASSPWWTPQARRRFRPAWRRPLLSSVRSA